MDKNAKSRSNTQESINIEKIKDSKSEYDKSIKVILLGDTNVGKSSIIDRLITNTFNINQPTTVGLEHHNLIIRVNAFTLRMQIWDTAGQEKFDSIAITYYKSTEVVIFIYAINIRNSFDRISDWVKQFENNSSKDDDVLKILIGNKTDLNEERKVTLEEGEDLAKKIGCQYFEEISCLDKENEENNNKFNKIIEVIGRKFYDAWKISKSDRLNSGSFNYVATESMLKVGEGRKEKKKCAC